MPGQPNRSKILWKLAVAYLVALALLAWGYAIGRHKVFPYRLALGTLEFVRGDPIEDTSLLEKLISDLGGAPMRFAHPRIFTLEASAYREVEATSEVFREIRARPVFYARNPGRGAYLIHGVFEFEDGRYGAVLVRQDGSLLRKWVFHRPPGNDDIDPAKGGLLPNGIVVSNAFRVLQAQDFCGNPLWSVLDGDFHHSIEAADETSFWVLNGFDFEKRNVADGRLISGFSIFEVMASNPDLHIFEARLRPFQWEISDLADFAEDFPRHELALDDPFHFNDATPLDAALANRYPTFRAGDLLLSARSLNLLAMVRPETREVLWYRQGITSRQHDADFNHRGTISVLDNNNHGPFSRIVEISPEGALPEVLVDGADFQWVNDAHGNYQFMPDGSVAFVDYFGRLLHVDANGSILFEFQNLYSDTEMLAIRNVHYLSDDEVAALELACH
jgi:hypothetical protein